MAKKNELQLTTADLVVLSLLAEQPMHGYQVNAELQRREVQDWAGISKPQIYYSLKKLFSLGFTKSVSGDDSLGPERETFAPTASGIKELAKSLEREEWAQQRPPPPFLTWLVLSSHTKPQAVQKIFKRRRDFLQEQIQKEERTLAAIRADHGPTVLVAGLIVELTIRQFQVELEWLNSSMGRLKR